MTDEYSDDPIGAGLKAVMDRLGQHKYRAWLLTPGPDGRMPFALALADNVPAFTAAVRLALSNAVRRDLAGHINRLAGMRMGVYGDGADEPIIVTPPGGL